MVEKRYLGRDTLVVVESSTICGTGIRRNVADIFRMYETEVPVPLSPHVCARRIVGQLRRGQSERNREYERRDRNVRNPLIILYVEPETETKCLFERVGGRL